MMTRRCSPFTCEKGAVAAITVLALPVMILAAGLVIDAANVVWARAAAQSAADLAALAAVQELDLDRLARGERWLTEHLAVARAREVAVDNLSRAGEALGAGNAGIRVRVYNVRQGETVVHQDDGRPLGDPTVCVTLELRARLPFLSAVNAPVVIRAHADASVVERKR